MTIDEIPVEWLCGPGVLVDLTDEMDELAIYTPKMIEDRVEVKKGDFCSCTQGWEKHRSLAARQTRRSTSTGIRARTRTWCRGCSRRAFTSGAWTASPPTIR
jgi:kynurenine formamidase